MSPEEIVKAASDENGNIRPEMAKSIEEIVGKDQRKRWFIYGWAAATAVAITSSITYGIIAGSKSKD
jgi:hypothetical protein